MGVLAGWVLLVLPDGRVTRRVLRASLAVLGLPYQGDRQNDAQDQHDQDDQLQRADIYGGIVGRWGLADGGNDTG